MPRYSVIAGIPPVQLNVMLPSAVVYDTSSSITAISFTTTCPAVIASLEIVDDDAVVAVTLTSISYGT